MRTLRLSLAVTVILVLLSGMNSVVVGQDAVDEPVEPESFLFVGNSLTGSNEGVYEEFERLIESEDPPRDPWVFRVLKAGTILGSNLSMTEYRLSQDDYDVVILQDDIPEYQDQDLERFMRTAREFDEMIHDAGAQTVFFMTWPTAGNDWVSLDEIVALHRQAEEGLGARIAPVGLAFPKAEAELPGLQTLQYDGDHPTLFGTYLAAAVIYATIFDRSPEGLYYPERILSEDWATTLQRIAWETVQEWRAEPPAE